MSLDAGGGGGGGGGGGALPPLLLPPQAAINSVAAANGTASHRIRPLRPDHLPVLLLKIEDRPARPPDCFPRPLCFMTRTCTRTIRDSNTRNAACQKQSGVAAHWLARARYNSGLNRETRSERICARFVAQRRIDKLRGPRDAPRRCRTRATCPGRRLGPLPGSTILTVTIAWQVARFRGQQPAFVLRENERARPKRRRHIFAEVDTPLDQLLPPGAVLGLRIDLAEK